MQSVLRITFILALAASLLRAAAAPQIFEEIEVAPVPATHPVPFCLLTHGQLQYIAFYDQHRRMTVGLRTLGQKSFKLHPLQSPGADEAQAKSKWNPVVTNFDSHNSVTLAVDSLGHLHLSGNMHCHPLVYFRTTKPGDITSITQVKSMVGPRELRCTYPRFLTGPTGQLIFAYRDGSSGNGVDVYNVYDPSTQTWKRLFDQPLLDGEGKCNGYSVGPTKGPDGLYHLVWVWRNTPDCSTNHDLSYARSKDLIHWETSQGKPLTLPITRATADVVDPVPVKGGMVNGNTKLGFDTKARPIIAYHKFDAEGKTQLYNARLEDGRWNIVQANQWDYRWDFAGGGTIIFEVSPGPVTLEGGKLVQTYAHKVHGSGAWTLDEATLKPSGTYRPTPRWPSQLGKVQSTLPDMRVHLTEDKSTAADPNAKTRYVMRWETLPANRDRPRPGEQPQPSILKVYGIRLAD